MLALSLFAALTVFPPVTVAADLADTIVRIKPSIVGVGTVQQTRRPPGQFLGTGFVVADGLHAITNYHVIPEKMDLERNEFLAVLTGDEAHRIRKARVIKFDAVHDVALVEFDGPPLPAMDIGDSARVREGETYAFTGFPIGIVIGMFPVTHRGIVSAITPIAIPQISGRELDANMIKRLREPYTVFQLDATAYPGNSGSPLYDVASGRVIGVVNSVFVKETKESVLEKPSGISYAIPSAHVIELLRAAGL